MTKIKNIKPAEPKLTLAEAKRILAQAVLKLEDHKVSHPEYKESVASIRNVASKFLQKGDAVSRKRKINSSISEEKKNETKKKKEETPAPKEIIVPAQEKPGPCPCINCSKQCHIPGLNISHRCPRCTKSFQKTSHLRSHMLVHTSVREHTCAECAAQFKRHDQLVRHLYTHDPEKAKQRFRCKKCKSTFTRKDNFKIHIKRKKVCRDTIKDGNIDSVLEVLESGKNTVVVKPAKDKNKDRDRKKSSSPVGTKTENLKLQEKDLNTLQLQGKEAMLVPVTHNSDGTLTITGDAINLPSPEAERLLAADNSTVTEGLESAHSIQIDNNQYVITCSDDKDLYDEPAKTPTDIVDLDTNMPITDQIAYRSQESEFYQAPTVVIDSGLGYQTEFTNVGVNAVHNDAHFGSVHTEQPTSVRNVAPESEPVMNEHTEEICEKADDKVVKTAIDHDGKEIEMKELSPGTRDFPLCAELMRLAEVPQIGVQDQLMGTNPTEIAQTELYSVVQTSPSETVYTQQSSENNTIHPSSSYGSSPTAQFAITLSAPCSNSHHGAEIISNTVDQQVTEEGASNSHLQSIVVGNINQDNAIQPAQLIVLQQEFAIHDSTQQESSQGTGQISQDKVLDFPPLPAQQEGTQNKQTDPPTDILSKVIEDILADTGVEPLDEVDDQIINVMQGGHTITSTPPRTKSAMDLLKAVIFMSSRIPAGSSLPAPAITAGGCEAGGFRLQDHEPGDLMPGAAVGINTDMLETAAPSPKTPDGKTLKLSKTPRNTPRKTPRKTPKSRQPKSKNKGSPKNNIDNSHKPGEDSFVKQIFRAKKRLFSEKCDEDENQLSSKIIKLDSGPMILGQDVLEQNDKLRAAALGDVLNTEASCLSKANGDKEGLNISNKQEILPLADIDEERAERDQPSVHSEVNAPLTEVLSPFTEQLIGESLTNRDNILSPISPLQVSSPFTHQESPNFLFFNSPVRSKTPDPQHFTSGRSSPLFLRSQTPDNSFLRSSTPERTILQTPDQSKLGGLSFEQEEQTFEDNFIWRELEHMFKSKRSSPGNPENYWFQP